MRPISSTGSLILLSHNILSFCASISFFVNLLGIGDTILFLRNALTSLSEILSFKVIFMHYYYFNTDIGSSLV
mgnify:CR=1 FL=1